MLRDLVLGAEKRATAETEAGRLVIEFVTSEFATLSMAGATNQHSLRAAQRIAALVDAVANGQPVNQVIADLPESLEPAVPTDEPSGVSLDGGTPSEFSEGDGGGQMMGELDGALASTAEEGDGEMPEHGGLRLLGLGGSVILEQRTYRYDEWDYHENRHRRDWCRVIEEPLVGDDPDFILSLIHI